ncbi:DNA-binding IclR family transcriptional regulator [Sphingobium wenxiniae]|uniref:IclR family transcriptional regulator n=2 Tax=Sphingobium TaxID=165695 RepID=T0HLY2_9SPHN|nr:MULTISPECIES: helix-turn-helix domain-containing protein [Sphingobium]EQA98593.1 hypothetical protein L485_18075 [Sphingobium baderi LL03]KMS61752.1 hypothetical protein V475_11650 [Sphingobium baderi LL03]MBB6193475.1 DNA-binding IclR family transcriptional regulator [Sphingobium wenxiniae]WRD75342.1 IclR family transcriptional regulator [Sphingobium baderi]
MAMPTKLSGEDSRSEGEGRPGSGKIVGATINTMRILRHLSRLDRPVGVSFIARDTNIVPSTCFNILRTLVNEGYVRFLPDTKTYMIGDGVIGLANVGMAHHDYLAAVQPMMERIAHSYSVTVTIWRRVSYHRMILLASAENRSALRIQMNVGHQLPLLIGGMARIMALQSDLSEDERQTMYGGLRIQRPLAYWDFIDQAKEALDRGWGIDDGYSTAGVTALAAPVRFDGPPITMVCSATMFRDQHDSATLTRIGHELIELATSVAQVVPASEQAPVFPRPMSQR